MVHLEHGVELTRGGGIGGEIERVALAQPAHQLERARKLALRAAGVAALHLHHELADRRDRRPARHAVVGDIEHAVGLQALAHDGDDRVLDRPRHPAQDPVRRDHVAVVVTAARSGLLEAGLRYGEVVQFGAGRQPPRMRHVLGVEVVALAGDVGIGGGQQRKAEPLPEAELEHAPGLERAAGRAAEAERRERHVARRGLAIEAGGVADVGDVAGRPGGHDTPPRGEELSLRARRSLHLSPLAAVKFTHLEAP